MCSTKGSAKYSGCGTTFSHAHSQCLTTLRDGRPIDFLVNNTAESLHFIPS